MSAQLVLDRFGELVDLLLEEVQVRKDRADDKRMMGLKAALQRLLERGDLRAQLALRQIGEDLRVSRAGDETRRRTRIANPRLQLVAWAAPLGDRAAAVSEPAQPLVVGALSLCWPRVGLWGSASIDRIRTADCAERVTRLQLAPESHERGSANGCGLRVRRCARGAAVQGFARRHPVARRLVGEDLS